MRLLAVRVMWMSLLMRRTMLIWRRENLVGYPKDIVLLDMILAC